MDYKMSATQVQSYQKMKILMLAETEYPGDTRVRQEAELLQSNGYKVSVVALPKKKPAFLRNPKWYKVVSYSKDPIF